MAKAIKRVGVMLLAVAIICLMAIGVLLGATSAKSKSDNLLDLNNKIVNAVPPTADETIILNGTTCANQATLWNNAITKAKTGKHIKVVLEQDWLAVIGTVNSFGTGVGFDNYRLYVPQNTTITLDLNGHIIDRRLVNNVAYGAVMYVEGVLNLMDSNKYESLIFSDAYYNDLENTNIYQLAKDLGVGRISGGYAGAGGGIYSENTGILNMYGGMICDNIGVSSGAGIAFVGKDSQINIYNGIITQNKTTSGVGGGIHYNGNKSLNIYGGFICNNYAQTSGGGIHINGTTIAGTSETTKPTMNLYEGFLLYNHANDDGGAANVTGEATLNMYGGEVSYNDATSLNHSCGGAFCILGSSKFNMYGGRITNNTCDSHGGGVHLQGNYVCTIKNGIITENKSNKIQNANSGGGIMVYQTGIFNIGAGAQIYNNYETDYLNNVSLYEEQKIDILEDLVKSEKSTYIGVTMRNLTGLFTNDYNYGTINTLHANKIFFSDKSEYKVVLSSSGEAELVEGIVDASIIDWEWEGEISGTTELTHITLPYYSDKAYKISGNVNDNKLILKNKNGESKKVFEIKEKGSYAFYVDGDYQNPTFMVTIEEKTLITSPDDKIKTFLYNGSSHTYLPEGFDSSIMEIKNNVATNVGVHTAKIILKNKQECVWRETGNYRDLEYKYVVLPPGIKAKELSGYEYLFKDNTDEGVYRKMYIEKEYWHLLNDSVVNQTVGNARYVLGNIPQNTNIESFINNLENDKTLLKIYNSKGEKVFNGVLNDANKNILIATGFKVELYENSTATQPYDEIYLSVLGDVVADGVINTLDITYINRIAKGEIALSELSLEQQLAAMVDNKGKVTSTDGKILLNVIGGNTQTNSYFESNANITNDYMLWDLSIDSVTGKTYRVGTELTATSLANNAIIGNIAPKTKASEFKAKLSSQLGVDIRLIAIYKANGVVASDDDYVGTGCYFNYNSKTIYLSVLGDLTGDGIVNTMDVTCLNRIISGNVKLNTNEIKDKLTILSASIQNKGNLTTADSETLMNYIGGNADMTKYY